MKHVATKLFVVLIAAALPLGLGGCAAQPGDDPAKTEAVGTAGEAWDTGCLDADPDESFTFTGSYVSPATYSNPGCYKSQVVWFSPLDVTTQTVIGWNGDGPSGGPDCDALFLGVYAWSWSVADDAWVLQNNGAPWVQRGVTYDGNLCIAPIMFFHPTGGGEVLPNGTSTILAITARTQDSSGAPTVPIYLDAY